MCNRLDGRLESRYQLRGCSYTKLDRLRDFRNVSYPFRRELGRICGSIQVRKVFIAPFANRDDSVYGLVKDAAKVDQKFCHVRRLAWGWLGELERQGRPLYIRSRNSR